MEHVATESAGPGRQRRRGLALGKAASAATAILVLGTGAFAVPAGAVPARAVRTVASYTWAPSPLGPPSTLAAGAKVTATVTALSTSGTVMGGATVYLSFTPAAGGGKAATHRLTIGTPPQAFRTNAAGQITVAYRTPTVLPSGGTDTITAANAATASTVQASDTYSFSASPPPPVDWPMFHHDQAHLGVSSDTTIGASNAAGLSVKWQTSLGAGSYASPVVAWNAQLGKLVVYVGDQTGGGHGGTMTALDAATGAQLWKFAPGGTGAGDILSSAAVSNGVVYFGSSSHTLFAVDATTGAAVCSFTSTGKISSSPVVADPGDGGGPVVYFGDNGLTGTGLPDQGNFWAVKASDCSLKWQFSAFAINPAGSYDEPAFAKDASGRAVVVFGTTDNDDGVYALDAKTGAQVWRFQTLQGTDTDVGAGPTVSAPGVNGFTDGVVYITGKDRITYALDLTTGSQIWSFDIKADTVGNNGDSQSVATLVGNRIYLGWGGGLYSLDAVTGAKVWKVSGLPTVYSSPAVSGASGNQVLLVGDSGGTFRAYDLNGNSLYSLATGGFLYSSPSVSAGKVYIANAVTGVLYAFG